MVFNGLVQEDSLFSGTAFVFMDDYCKEHVHEIFSPWQIMKAINTGCCGSLNLNGGNTFNSIQDNLRPYE